MPTTTDHITVEAKDLRIGDRLMPSGWTVTNVLPGLSDTPYGETATVAVDLELPAPDAPASRPQQRTATWIDNEDVTIAPRVDLTIDPYITIAMLVGSDVRSTVVESNGHLSVTVHSGVITVDVIGPATEMVELLDDLLVTARHEVAVAAEAEEAAVLDHAREVAEEQRRDAAEERAA